ncbi:MAG: hypothetical protein A2X13_04050 [Bacteroidetes bacterium GWC2_33_15]|nr:MAG: hypothetical protein A2X10_00815 [Bacteroidetes bacterium GWA2_33_15]OFX49695.1 MAG: hypothetical protein A2X13_04050 [Bacteroidetes bacterium GWC2_33_15]OFX65915.1 MAG: hypothetical protein A2X15_10785 [Bacteroidetes bacterium GWB2_32_14]OFX68324.1 MAG: hypothetical protein A2X14_08110 [Bacteroidetes bacterium GWD2_33_33]HAN18109.1 hypothetical protein [Bacteroidales bacterium]
MKKLSFIFILIHVFVSNLLNAQQIENLRVKQLNDKINLVYDLVNEKTGQQFDIKLYCSTDAGANFSITANTVTGDIGSGIYGGKDKIIVWDVLKDVKNLKSDQTVFKLVATPGIVKNQSDYIEDFNFELIDCYKKERTVVCALKITNNGKKRDLKTINRLARIHDFKGTRIESNVSKLGQVSGNERYATPTLTFNPGQTAIALFQFNTPDGFSNRIKLLEFGLEILEITYGLDYKSGYIEFRDISLSNPDKPSKTEYISQSLKMNIGTETLKIEDTKAPSITFTSPIFEKNKSFLVKTEDIILKGKVTDENGIFNFTINGMDIPVNPDGTFETDIFLVEGENNVFVRATDIFQNNIEFTRLVVFKPEQKKDQRQTSIDKPKESDITIFTNESSKQGRFYALLIGVNEYPDPEIVDLDKPVQDAEKLYQNLTTNYTFDPENVTLLKNPTHEDIISELDRLDKLITEKDNLLIFYAGHGYWDTEDEVGYWLPSDSKQANTANWLRNSTIRDYLRTVKTKHTLLIADACFSGGIFKSRNAFADAPKSIQKLYELPSRKAMTSGTLEEVPDKSVFMLYLNKRLEENTQQFISAEELFSSFKTAVLNNSPNIPQYGEIKDTGDEGGDFIFVKKVK